MNREENYLKKELYELLKDDERIFDFLQKSSTDGFWYLDLEHPENEWMNPQFWITLGYNPDEMPQKSAAWQSIINQEDLKKALDNLKKHCENPKHPYDQIVRYTHKNGSTVWIRCRGIAIRDKKGKPVRMLGTHHDITDLKNNELKLRYKEEELKKQLKFVKALNRIAEIIINIDNAEQLLSETNQIIGETLELDRALIYYVSFDPTICQP